MDTVKIQALCPDHGHIELTVDDVLLAETVVLLHCSEQDHLFLLGLTPRAESELVAAHVERLCP